MLRRVCSGQLLSINTSPNLDETLQVLLHACIGWQNTEAEALYEHCSKQAGELLRSS